MVPSFLNKYGIGRKLHLQLLTSSLRCISILSIWHLRNSQWKRWGYGTYISTVLSAFYVAPASELPSIYAQNLRCTCNSMPYLSEIDGRCIRPPLGYINPSTVVAPPIRPTTPMHCRTYCTSTATHIYQYSAYRPYDCIVALLLVYQYIRGANL